MFWNLLYIMPRKAKVQAVPVEDKPEGLAVAMEAVEEKTDAEQLTDVINEVNATPDEVVEPALEVEAPVEAPVEVKPKAKRAPKAKAKAEAPPEVTLPPVPEAPPPSVEAEEVAAQVEPVGAKEDTKVACPDCGKQMSAKTLKYSRKCVTAKAVPASLGVRGDETTSRIVEIVEDEVEKRLNNRRAERVARREAIVERLMQSAF